MNFKKVVTPFVNFHILNKKNTKSTINYDGYVYIFASEQLKKSKALLQNIIEMESLPYQEVTLLKSEQKLIHFIGVRGPTWILFESGYGNLRDRAGALATQMRNQKLKNIHIEISEMNEDDLIGLVNGFELSMYHFLQIYKNETLPPIEISLSFVNTASKIKQIPDFVRLAQHNATAVQLARHLVNLPPNIMNPEAFEKLVTQELSFSKSSQIEIWNEDRCKKEGLNLLVAVGHGASHASRLVHIKYRPRAKKKNQKPIAFIGKGITFDTGGLDIKPSGAMRWMKKDMGGAAAVVALAYWVDQTQFEKPCDFYLALAENAVDAKAMRPGDVYRSHAGYLVEIDNTDAEGRLVLADAMSVAATQKETPQILIDVATLTGAIKVALGAEVAGLFSNDDQLAMDLFEAGDMAYEPNWRMPLVQKYFSSLSSNFADFRNSGDGGFGGAITAALFLEKFCHGIRWAHLDVYSWTDRAEGAMSSVGGNGQPVQTLIAYLENLK